MSTEKLYDSDSFLNSFTALVTECTEGDSCFYVKLTKTAFFPEGGGQAADTGAIGEAVVIDVKEKDGEILHKTDRPLNIGSEYNCRIDWETRFSRMQNHTAEHIVSGLIHSEYGFNNVGFHMTGEIVTVDIDGEISRDEFDGIEEKANKAVWANLPVSAVCPPKDELKALDYRSKLDLTENVRIVTIPGVDICACCAPHVKQTGQIGLIKILDIARHRGGTRFTMKAGKWALDDSRDKYFNVREISELLSAKQAEAFDAVKRMQDELYAASGKFSEFCSEVVRSDINSAECKNSNTVLISGFYTADMLREFVNGVLPDTEKLAAAFSGSDEGGYTYIAASKTVDMKAFSKEMNTALNGRGGGRDGMIQGRVNASKEEITAFFGK